MHIHMNTTLSDSI